MFESILIANRGEIAVRVIRAAREMGIRCIAVYSDADEGAFWTRLADESHRLGPAPARESYLNIDRVVQAAVKSGASAVHPGYGLLSESAEFAQAVMDADIAFIGPKPATIALMGDKVEARRAAIACGVPVLPGSGEAVASAEEAFELAEGIGWPIAVKASFGGGGRGMRVAADASGLAAALEQAGREATAAFGRGAVFLERYLIRPRHVEVQVLGDRQGTVIHLGNRDCSVQRRHQKLIEEAPAPNVPARLRDRVIDAALTLCRSVDYQSAGTVEFLVDIANDAFYFLEMNTRLQVEHGVTELVTGIDLVKQQIMIGAGERLTLTQSDIKVTGHAIQARIAAEDPWEGFRPVPGRIDRLSLPLGPWLRLDFGVESGDSVQRHYDSMFGKVQAWGHDREEARRRLVVALATLIVDGIPTTGPYVVSLLERTPFIAATHDTGSLEREWLPDPAAKPIPTLIPSHFGQAVTARVSERRVAVPWGGRFVDVSVYGVAAVGINAATSGAPARTGPRSHGASGSSDGPLVTTPMDAVVISISVALGQAVAKGAPLLVLEAMKMEVVVGAPHDGIVDGIAVSAGQTVKSGSTLMSVLNAPPAAGS